MHQQGSKAIDGIFLSHLLLEEAKGGLLHFGEVMVSNHHTVWINLPMHHFNMKKTSDITRTVGQRLKC